MEINIKYDSIGVIGGGSWGTTLAHLLGKNGNKVLLWLRDKKIKEEINTEHTNKKYTQETKLSEKIKATLDLEEIAEKCEICIVAIPSQSFRKVIYELGNYIKGDQILISATKGLEEKTYKRMSEIIKEETCVKKIGVLSGPNLYKEILNGSPSASVIASRYHEVIEKVTKILSNKDFRLYGNLDICGVELGGVTKNVIAIAAGIIDSLDFGNNTKAFLITRGMVEMSRIGVKLGANPLTFNGLAGIGDTIVTCSGKLSRNYTVGYYLAKGETLSQILKNRVTIAEGVNAAKVLYEICREININVPIINGIYEILYKNRPIKDVISELMSRKPHFEIENF